MARRKKRPVTDHLIEMAGRPCFTVDDLTDPSLTQSERLAMITWMMAQGWQSKDAKDQLKTDKPAKWAIDILYERLEGRVKPTEMPDTGKQSMVETVSERTRAELDDLAEAAFESVSEDAENLGGPDYEDEDSQSPLGES